MEGLDAPGGLEASRPQPAGLTEGRSISALMLSVEQACKLLGIGRTTLWALVRDGEIGAVKTGSRLQFPLPIVEEYVARQVERAREQAARRQRLGARSPRR